MNRNNNPCRDQGQKNAIKDIGLVKASVILAVFIEILGIEADLIYGRFYDDIFKIFIVKMLCLLLILFPLVIYVKRNGLSALKVVWGRVTIVAVIVMINLAHNLFIFGGKLLGY
jgi:hypothetical protein